MASTLRPYKEIKIREYRTDENGYVIGWKTYETVKMSFESAVRYAQKKYGYVSEERRWQNEILVHTGIAKVIYVNYDKNGNKIVTEKTYVSPDYFNMDGYGVEGLGW